MGHYSVRSNVMSKLIIKSAMGSYGVIGNKGKLPWHIPEDLKDFKASTIGKPIIMGRKTFESLPSILPDRIHVVVTSNREYELPHPNIVADSLEDAIASVWGEPIIYIVGGAEIYKQAMEYVDEIELTIINKQFEGDTYFPDVSVDDWVIIKTEPLVGDEVIKYTYRRR